MRKRKKYLVIILVVCLLWTREIEKNSIVSYAEEDNYIAKESITNISDYETNEIIVMYKEDTAKKVKTKALSNDVKEESLSNQCALVTVKDKETLQETIELLSQDEDVLFIQPNYKYYLMDNSVDDVDFSKQWWAYNDGTFVSPSDTDVIMPDFPPFERHEKHFWPYTTAYWGEKTTTNTVSGIDINIVNAWEQFTRGGRETIVAVVDTGIDYGHQELSSVMWTNSKEIVGDGIDNDNNGYIDDVNGWNFYDGNTQIYIGKGDEDDHATHIAGVIGAAHNNVGIAGIASNTNIKIMSVKALGGKDGSGTTESIIRGIQYAEDNGAVICNLSVGTEYDDPALKEVMQNSDMLFVVASGNESSNIDQVPVYPASYDLDNIISVANLQFDGTLHSSSNYGSKSVDIAAPGTYIYSTISNDSYTYMTGTSMAAPMVTGVAALVYSYYNGISTSGVKEIILKSASALSSLTGKVLTGGMVDAYAALNQTVEARMLETQSKQIETINLNISQKTLKIGKVYQLKTTVEPSDATGTITFQSDNKKVASVTKNTGKIKAKKAGKATITVTTDSGKVARCVIKVKKN